MLVTQKYHSSSQVGSMWPKEIVLLNSQQRFSIYKYINLQDVLIVYAKEQENTKGLRFEFL